MRSQALMKQKIQFGTTCADEQQVIFNPHQQARAAQSLAESGGMPGPDQPGNHPRSARGTCDIRPPRKTEHV